MGEVELGEAVCQVPGTLGFLFKAWFTQYSIYFIIAILGGGQRHDFNVNFLYFLLCFRYRKLAPGNEEREEGFPACSL